MSLQEAREKCLQALEAFNDKERKRLMAKRAYEAALAAQEKARTDYVSAYNIMAMWEEQERGEANL